MRAEQTYARSAIEALRSGVPSRHSAEHLGTTQDEIRAEFERRLRDMADGRAVDPIVLSATFGAGKSHLLNYLKALASNQGCVTSFVVVSPEQPLGNAHLILRGLAEAAEAPGRTGRALRALSTDLMTNTTEFANLRLWTRDNGLDDRFVAMLHLFEEHRADEELRNQILSDFEGNPIIITLLRQKLKEIGQSAGYALKGKRNALLAHDRIRLMARFFRTCGCPGWVLLFDELERFAFFPTRQRLATWEELGWWQEIARQEGASLLPVFAVASGLAQHTIEVDEPRYRSVTLGIDSEERDRWGLAGIDMVRNPMRIVSPTDEQKEQIRYRVRSIYESAYDMQVGDSSAPQRDRTIRSEIRRWITEWDLHRYYPEHRTALVEDDVIMDETEVPDEDILSEESTEDG